MASLPPQFDIIQGINSLGMDLYRLLSVGEKNVLLCPYALSSAVLLVDLGATGQTEEEIRAVFRLEFLRPEMVHEQFRALTDAIKEGSSASTETILQIVSKVYSLTGLTIREDYKSALQSYYNTDIEQLNFNKDRTGSRLKINRWIESKTEGKIRNVFPPVSMNARAHTHFVNAAILTGHWARQFDPSRTENKPFWVSEDQFIDTPMMPAKRKFKFFRDNDIQCSGIELPYDDEQLSFFAILPDLVNGLRRLEERLSSGYIDSFCEAVRTGQMPDVSVLIPKFKLLISHDLSELLPDLGVRLAFDPCDADLGGMIEDQHPDACVGEVKHVAWLEVNENGLEPSSTKDSKVPTPAPPPTRLSVRSRKTPGELAKKPKPKTMNPQQFVADHPFLFVVRENKHGTFLFLGRLLRPEGEISRQSDNIQISEQTSLLRRK